MSLVNNSTSVPYVDPIEERKKLQTSFFRRLFITTWHGGKSIRPPLKFQFGHYMWCGPQGSSKTLSLTWTFEYLQNYYKKKGYKTDYVFSNFGIGQKVTKKTLFPIIQKITEKPDHTNRYKDTDKVMNFILIDEIQSYFPSDFMTKDDKIMVGQLVQKFSQLRKGHIFILSTAQIYGRLCKPLREQCLFMINCRKSKLTNHVINEWFKQEDILCDELGRWSGIPFHIYSHGLPVQDYDTSRLITE